LLAQNQKVLSETELIARIKQHDGDAFEQIFRKYYAELCGYADKYLNDTDAAEEIVQELFCHIWDKRETIEIKETLRAYFFRATRNRCFNHFRHLKIREAHQQETQAENNITDNLTAYEAMKGFELEEKITQVINQLPAQCKLVFSMSRFEGKKYQEIADELGISKKAVEAHISKALKVLREELKEYLPLLLLLFSDFF
jgi:RNA polymerase sigma-70 factor (ECF subfamily)